MTLDLIVCGLVLFFALLGAAAGGLIQLSHWAGLIVAGLAAKPLGVKLGPMAAARFAEPEIVGLLGVTVLAFFVVYAMVQIMVRMLITRIVRNRALSKVDRVLGFTLGGGKAAAILFVLLSALIFFEKPFTQISKMEFDTRGSRVADFIRAHDLFTNFSLPGTGGLTALARAAQDPRAAAQLAQDPAFVSVTRDPRVQALLRDGQLQRALQGGDTLGLLRDNRVVSVLSDPAISEKLQHVGESLPNLAAPGPAPARTPRR